jgi:putative acetyltransferase
MSLIVREIEPWDNSAIAVVIREALEEHGVARPGTVYTDPTTDDLYTLFRRAGSVYFVLELDAKIVGGCGLYPTQGLPEDCVELVKLYTAKEVRGRGFGALLMERSAEAAKALGYKQLYLETLPELGNAVSLYDRMGYVNLDGPLGDSGHFACSIWMLKTL